MRRNKQKSDFMNYIIFLNSIISEVKNVIIIILYI